MNNTYKERIKTCENGLIMLAYEAEKDSPYEFLITCGHRTIEIQKELYAQGRTKPGKKVTYIDGEKKKSKHNYIPSKAFDFAVKINGEITWEENYYKEVGDHFKNVANKLGIKINWGGDFKKFKDYPHIETKI
jgi:peptidoglycan L-alanyl-D-glutamate endopeptidase CwlK